MFKHSLRHTFRFRLSYTLLSSLTAIKRRLLALHDPHFTLYVLLIIGSHFAYLRYM